METTYRYFTDQLVVLDDGSDYRNAVLRRCQLVYRGGDLRIEGALFFDCGIKFDGDGARASDLYRALFASLYVEGHREIGLNPDGSWYLGAGLDVPETL